MPSWSGQEGRCSLPVLRRSFVFGNVLFHLSCMFGSFLIFLTFCLWIAASGLVACSGMAGFLVSAAMVVGPLGLLLLVSWLAWS